MANEMNKIFNLNPANVLLTFNTVVADVFYSNITSLADIAKTQANIDKLYAIAGMSKERVNALNMEYQLKVVDFLATQPANAETTAQSVATFAKIKEIRVINQAKWALIDKLKIHIILYFILMSNHEKYE